MKQSRKNFLDSIRKKHNLALILLHGSQVKGLTHPESDIDIAVLPESGSEIKLLDLIADLANIYRSDKIDITDLAKADPLLLYSVSTKSTLLSGANRDYAKFKLKSFKRYTEYLPYLKLEQEIVLKNLDKFS